jgi:uncharacterized protein (DUF885 family)
MTDAGAQFAAVARTILEDTWAANPVMATRIGVHEHDGELPDPTAAGADLKLAAIRAQLAALDSVPLEDIGYPDAIDGEILRTRLTAQVLELGQLREGDWNPMLYNPGPALHGLLSRDFAPLPQRLASVRGRLAAIPEYLAGARGRLTGRIPLVHAQTALTQMRGTLALLDREIPAAAKDAEAGGSIGSADVARSLAEPLQRARDAVREQLAWLSDLVEGADGQAHLGPELYAAKLWLTLDTPMDPQRLLRRAQEDLDRITEQLVDAAGALAGAAAPDADTVRAMLARLGQDAPDDATILSSASAALHAALDFLADGRLLTVPDGLREELEVVEMPEVSRGVAVAFCQSRGALEAAAIPTLFAVAPTPAGWSDEQVRSFYREYNDHMLHDLAVHEGAPGHGLQLTRSREYAGSTPIRTALWSGTFVEGWAVYAEELMVEAGFRSDVSAWAAGALRMQQLKMQLRCVLNAIMDIRFHTGDLTESEAMRLMTGPGFQEQGEAAGKWRRVQLTSTQLCTYYVGYLEVRDLVRDLRAQQPTLSTSEVHDLVLSQGSPPPRHLRDSLDLPVG